jgi:hypothetical protein
MWWYLLQGSIIFAVAASNIHWQWTPNPYVVGLIGVGLAYGVTALLSARVWKRPWYRLRD